MRRATCVAGVNIALVKYWGKRDVAQNLPAVGSISLTIDALHTVTTVTFEDGLRDDLFTLDGVESKDDRVITVLDTIRNLTGVIHKARVESENHVPTASGLASSASGTAALASAAWCAAGGVMEDALTLSSFTDCVRCGSGSAPRSLLGGLVELDRDSGRVHQLVDHDTWPLAMVVVQIGSGRKATSSRAGMQHTADTSPYYAPWVAAHPRDLVEARAAIEGRDLARLGAVMERSTMRMHACMLAADPPLRYLRGATLDAMAAVESLRADGVGAWYTMDAGPHVKVLCAPADAATIAARLEDEGRTIRVAHGGPGARKIDPC